jgi:hypothetical protein
MTGFLLEVSSEFVCLYIELSLKGAIPEMGRAILIALHMLQSERRMSLKSPTSCLNNVPTRSKDQLGTLGGVG